jgi:hypothetical protein
MRTAVLNQNHIVALTNNLRPIEAVKIADKERGLRSDRSFTVVEQHSPAVEYHVYEIDKADFDYLNDFDRFSDPRYVGFVKTSCKLISSFAVK